MEGQNYNILIAEDCPDTRLLIEETLSIISANVKSTLNGKECLDEAVDAWKNEKPYDLILLDIQMPVMDGNVTAKSLRDQGYKLPIVAMTAQSTQEDIDRTLQSGCDAFISKLGGVKSMLKEVSKQLSKPKVTSSLELPVLSVVPSMIKNNPQHAVKALHQLDELSEKMESLKKAIIAEDSFEVAQIVMKLSAFSLLGYENFSENLQYMQSYAAEQDFRGLKRILPRVDRAARGMLAGRDEIKEICLNVVSH